MSSAVGPMGCALPWGDGAGAAAGGGRVEVMDEPCSSTLHRCRSECPVPHLRPSEGEGVSWLQELCPAANWDLPHVLDL